MKTQATSKGVSKKLSVSMPEDLLGMANERAAQEQRTLSSYLQSLVAKDCATGVLAPVTLSPAAGKQEEAA